MGILALVIVYTRIVKKKRERIGPYPIGNVGHIAPLGEVFGKKKKERGRGF